MLVTFNARNEHDRCKFAEDLRESISEMDEMETLRIEAELERQKSARGGTRANNSENRDSGVADVEVCAGVPYQGGVGGGTGTGAGTGLSAGGGISGGGISPNDHLAHGGAGTGGGGGGGHGGEAQLKRSALSNSLLDMHEQCKSYY